MQYDHCSDVNWSLVDDKYLNYLNSKYKALISSLEEASKISDINILTRKMIFDKCKINSFEKSVKNKSDKPILVRKSKIKLFKPSKQENISQKKLLKIVKEKPDFLKKAKISTGISANAKDGFYPVIVEDNKKCLYFIKVNVEKNETLGKLEKKICNGKSEKDIGLIFNKHYYIDDVDYSDIGGTVYIYEI